MSLHMVFEYNQHRSAAHLQFLYGAYSILVLLYENAKDWRGAWFKFFGNAFLYLHDEYVNSHLRRHAERLARFRYELDGDPDWDGVIEYWAHERRTWEKF